MDDINVICPFFLEANTKNPQVPAVNQLDCKFDMKKLITTSLLASILFTFPATTAWSMAVEPSLSGTYLAGRYAGRLRDAEQAADYLETALKLDPGNPQIIERLFQYRLSEGANAEAEDLAAQVIEFNSQQRMARVVLGLKEFRLQHYKESREHFAEAAYTPVGELTATLMTAWTYAGEGSLNAALKELEKLDLNESFANFRVFHEALIADFVKSDLRADVAYKKAYAQAGASLRISQAYANYLQRKGNFAEAEKVLKAYLEKGEQSPLIQSQLAEVLTKKIPPPFIQTVQAGAGEALFSLAAAMNDDESADVALLYGRLALTSHTDKPVMQMLLGDIYSDMQQFEQSTAMYDQIDKQSPLRGGAEIQIALNLQRLKRSTDAENRLIALLKNDPANTDGWSTLGNIYRNNENYAAAVPAYTKAIESASAAKKPDWQLYYFKGISLERLKQWPDAEADLRKSLSLAPEEPSVLNYLGYSLIDRKEKLSEAISMVKRAVELKPNDGYIVDSLGWAHYQLGDYDEALTHMERAVDLKPGDPIIAEHLGDVYWRVGRKLEARFQWQHAKDNEPEPADLKRIEDKLQNGPSL